MLAQVLGISLLAPMYLDTVLLIGAMGRNSLHKRHLLARGVSLWFWGLGTLAGARICPNACWFRWCWAGLKDYCGAFGSGANHAVFAQMPAVGCTWPAQRLATVGGQRPVDGLPAGRVLLRQRVGWERPCAATTWMLRARRVVMDFDLGHGCRRFSEHHVALGRVWW